MWAIFEMPSNLKRNIVLSRFGIYFAILSFWPAHLICQALQATTNSGVYFYRISTRRFTDTKRFLLVK